MKPKRLVLFGLVMALLIWALSQLFFWIIADGLKAPEMARHAAPALAGFIIGCFQAAMVQMIRKKRQEMLGEQAQTNQ